MSETPKPDYTLSKSLISGAVGGMALVVTGQPFDTVKVQLQSGAYKTAGDAMKNIMKEAGPFGLYKGMLSPLIGATPLCAVSYWGYKVGQKFATSALKSQDPQGGLTKTQLMLAGGFSAIPQTLVTTPVERVKVQVQTGKYKGSSQAVMGLLKDGGLRSLYRGTVPTLLRDVPGNAAYYGAYEIVKKYMTPAVLTPENNTTAQQLYRISVAGGMGGIAMWVLILPIDTVKTLVQGGTYPSIGKAISGTAAKGIGAFYRGVGPAMLRAFPANAAFFVGVEYANKYLDKVL